jgi:hypothetical protein
VQNLLFRHLHHSHCPYLVRFLPVESLIDRAHGSLAQLLSEPIELVRIVRQKLYLLDLLIEIIISTESIFRNLLLASQPLSDLQHLLRVFFDQVGSNPVFGEQFSHLLSESLDSAGTVQVHLEMHLVLEVFGPISTLAYLLI